MQDVLTMARTTASTASTPLEPGPSTEMSSTNNVDNKTTPHENDVVLGRGIAINKHKGNLIFRNVVDHHKNNYVSAVNNFERRFVSTEVMKTLKTICPPGRFVRYDSNTNKWIEVSGEEAHNKTTQALRDASRGTRWRGVKNGEGRANNANKTNSHCCYETALTLVNLKEGC